MPRKSRFNESEKRNIVRERWEGKRIGDICKAYDISVRTFQTWQKEYGFTKPPAIVDNQAADLQEELEQYKQMIAEQRFEIMLLKKILDHYESGDTTIDAG